jgi:hypothetical protein
MRVEVEVEEARVWSNYGRRSRELNGLVITCSRCKHRVEVCGEGEDSFRAACAMLRGECPRQERNFYDGEGEWRWREEREEGRELDADNKKGMRACSQLLTKPGLTVKDQEFIISLMQEILKRPKGFRLSEGRAKGFRDIVVKYKVGAAR